MVDGTGGGAGARIERVVGNAGGTGAGGLTDLVAALLSTERGWRTAAVLARLVSIDALGLDTGVRSLLIAARLSVRRLIILYVPSACRTRLVRVE